MKTIICLTVVLLSSLAFADTVYVRKSVTEGGVSAADGEKVRGIIQSSVTSQGHRLVGQNQGNWALRAMVGKSDQGPYTVKVERYLKGQLVGSNHGSDVNLDEATRLATTNLMEALGKTSLPEKTTATHSASMPSAVVAENQNGNNGSDASPGPLAQEAKHPNNIKNWFIAVGPVVANSLVGTNGTKFAITLGYNLGVSEHFDIQFLSDNNFNTGSVGGTAVQVVAAGGRYFFNDRLSEFSPYVQIDLGFGGGNRANDATGSVAGAIGVEVYRTQAASFAVYLRNMTMLTNNGSSLSNYPNITQFMIGISF